MTDVGSPLKALVNLAQAVDCNFSNDQGEAGNLLGQEGVLQDCIIATTRPLENTAEIQFADLFEIETVQRLQDQFSNATGVASIITQVDGTPITKPSNFTRLCSKIIRNTEVGCSNCFKSDAVLGIQSPSGPIVRRCLSAGLWDAGASVTVGGKHIANWLIGQVRNEAQDVEQMLCYADEIGVDRELYRMALAEVRIMSWKQFERTAQMLFSFVRELSNRAFQNIQQVGLINERKVALRDAEVFNVSVCDSLAEHLAVIDDQGVIIMVNQAWRRFGEKNCAPGPVLNPIGTNYLHACEQPPGSTTDEVAVAAREGIRAVLKGTRTEFTMDYPCHSQDEQHWFQMNVTPLRGSRKGAVIAHLDITERKQAEKELLRAERIDSIGRLAAGIAHDLNNVLTPIILSAEMLPSAEDPATRECLISSIAECAQRGADVVSQVLAFARGSRGGITKVQLNHLVEDVEKIIRETFPRNIVITSSIQTDLWPVKADATQIHQIILNLCLNARDAMPEGGSLLIRGENVAIDENFAAMVSDAKEGSYAMLSIADSGMGISQKNIAKIFDPFFTTKEIGKGTGLGLSTVIGVVRSHGGFVTVESKEDQGCTFKVFLPHAINDAAEYGPVASFEVPRGEGETILVVDDEVLIAKTTAMVLKKNGYQALTAADGIEALAVYREHADEIHIVLTDVIMPGMGGVQLARALKEINPRVKIIASTGQPSKKRQSQLQALGVKVILRKPYDAGKLLAVLHEAIHSK
jgi:signal transduction histidine kinase/ligand-binding sensor protein/CheY-like chemotaxis protein